jgi:hypothetical protein
MYWKTKVPYDELTPRLVGSTCVAVVALIYLERLKMIESTMVITSCTIQVNRLEHFALYIIATI